LLYLPQILCVQYWKKLSAEQEIYDVVVVGGGVVGLASAWKVQLAYPHLRVLLLEKEEKLADHQTGHNSGVIHSGLYYKPGSYKAKNCVEGRHELVAFAKEHGIKHDVCGKVVVATQESELPFMDKIFNNGLQNQVEGIEKIGPERIKELEPHVRGIAGIWVPCTGIIDFRGLTEKLAELIVAKNPQSKVLTGHEVIGLDKHEGHTKIHTPQKSFLGKHLIFCGGLQADRLAKMDGVTDIGMRIVGFRGDYYDLTEQGKHKVKNLIYPVPNPAFPFLGVHFTRMVDGSTECGPNAVFVFKREGYGKFSFSLRDSFDALTYRGTWKLFFRQWRFGVDEYRRAFSKKLFLKQLRRLIPSLEMDDLMPGRAGVRAMALDPNGDMIDDFKIEYKQNSIHVLNAPSPAATSALAIGTAVREMAEKHFSLH
jgi:(S)-2-hydroxyglutarate dehydrogenase